MPHIGRFNVDANLWTNFLTATVLGVGTLFGSVIHNVIPVNEGDT